LREIRGEAVDDRPVGGVTVERRIIGSSARLAEHHLAEGEARPLDLLQALRLLDIEARCRRAR
jgi:hypothetical protein